MALENMHLAKSPNFNLRFTHQNKL
jgi:hypothetical protein